MHYISQINETMWYIFTDEVGSGTELDFYKIQNASSPIFGPADLLKY